MLILQLLLNLTYKDGLTGVNALVDSGLNGHFALQYHFYTYWQHKRAHTREKLIPAKPAA